MNKIDAMDIYIDAMDIYACNPDLGSLAILQRNVDAIAAERIKRMPLLQALTRDAVFVGGNCARLSFWDEDEGDVPFYKVESTPHMPCFNDGRKRYESAERFCEIAGYRCCGGRLGIAESPSLRSPNWELIETEIGNALESLAVSLVRTLYRDVPNMPQKRIESLRSPDNLCGEDWGFCLGPMNPGTRLAPLAPPFHFLPFLSSSACDPTVMLFAPKKRPVFCAFLEHMLWLSFDTSNPHPMARDYYFYIDCYVAIAPRNLRSWLAVTNHEWVVHEAEKVIERLAATV